MASTTEYKSGPPPPPPPAAVSDDYIQVGVAMRFLLFVLCLVAIVVMVTSKQTESDPRIFSYPFVAKIDFSPAFIYFVTAFSVAGLYSILTVLVSISVMTRPDLRLKFLLHFIFWDTLILGLVASATGAAGAVAYLALKGNDHVNWHEVCNVYDKFCGHLAGSLAIALFGSIVAIFLILLSATSLRSIIPK